MTNAVNGATRYLELEVFTMHPARRVVFLYDFLLANLRGARAALEAGRIEERVQRIMKAQDVIGMLQSTLNPGIDEAVTGQLDRLYSFFLTELLEINRHQDVGRLDRLIRMVGELETAWAEAASAAMHPGAGTGQA